MIYEKWLDVVQSQTYFADETDGAEEIIDDNEISKFVDKSDVSDIIKRDGRNHFEELLDKFEE